MSTIKYINGIHPSGSTNNLVFDSSGNTTAGGTLAMSSSFLRNRIINGAMVIDQRNAGASGTASAYTVDRWGYNVTQASKATWQQNAGSVTPPTGFTNYLGITSSSAYSVLTGDTFYLSQAIEGFNVADLSWGSASASTVTLSFWVRSSLTGTFGGALVNSAGNRSYPFSYTISAANTWEYKTITVAGDTTGTWLTNNGVGITLRIGLGSGSTYTGTAGAWAASNLVQSTGSTSVVGTNGATFYITGVQLEVGSVATPFERRLYGTELMLCQRYYQKSFPIGTAPAQNAGTTGAVYCQGQAASAPAYAYVNLKVTMRATPSTVTLYNPSAANGNWRNLVAGSDINSNVGMSSDSSLYINANTQVLARYEDAAIHYSASAEL